MFAILSPHKPFIQPQRSGMQVPPYMKGHTPRGISRKTLYPTPCNVLAFGKHNFYSIIYYVLQNTHSYVLWLGTWLIYPTPSEFIVNKVSLTTRSWRSHAEELRCLLYTLAMACVWLYLYVICECSPCAEPVHKRDPRAGRKREGRCNWFRSAFGVIVICKYISRYAICNVNLSQSKFVYVCKYVRSRSTCDLVRLDHTSKR